MSDMAIFPQAKLPLKFLGWSWLKKWRDPWTFFLLHLFLFFFFFLIYWQSRVLNSGTNILISCPCLSSLWLSWNNSEVHRFRLHPALRLQSSYLADSHVISSLSESCPEGQRGSSSFTAAPFESSRHQETEKPALLVQLAFTAEDNTDRKSVGVRVFLEGEENWGSKLKRSLSLIFHNRVLFPRFYSCNILCVWPDPS